MSENVITARQMKWSIIVYNFLPRDFMPMKRFSTMSILPTPWLPLWQTDRRTYINFRFRKPFHTETLHNCIRTTTRKQRSTTRKGKTKAHDPKQHSFDVNLTVCLQVHMWGDFQSITEGFSPDIIEIWKNLQRRALGYALRHVGHFDRHTWNIKNM